MNAIVMDTSQGATIASGAAISPEEWRIRVDLAAAYRLVAHFGWDDLVFTHLSARVPGPDHHFLINPFGMLFEEVTASSLVCIDVDGRPVRETPHPVNAAGFTIHSAIHMNRPDAMAITHVHSANGLAVSAMRDGLMALTQTAIGVRHDLAYHDYEGIALDLDERERLVADLGNKNLMILRNHGTLAVGATVAAAFTRLYMLERACEAQVRALTAGIGNVSYPSDEAIATAGEQTAPAATASIGDNLIWPALLRKLDRIDTSYRE